MYDELVKELRDSAEWADRLALLMGRAEGDTHAPIMRKAADAIEELIAKLNHADDQIDLLVEAAEERRWIPVTERLPESKKKVLVATFQGGVYYGFMESRGKFYTANNTLADSWCWEPNASHWMPLPPSSRQRRASDGSNNY